MTEDNQGKPRRLQSLDTLRGFDMFWIAGGEHLVLALTAATGWGFMKSVSHHMHHAEWEGFRFYDLIFPLFIFIMGVAIPFSIGRLKEQGVSHKPIILKLLRRFFILVVLGILYNQASATDYSNPRIASVLGQIAFAYLFAALIFLKTSGLRSLIIATAVILIGYGAIQLFVPVPGYGPGVLTQEGSINAFLDQRFTPGKLLGGTFEPEGVFNNISAIALALMGVATGLILKMETVNPYRKVWILVGIGITQILLAIALNGWYPIIKMAWTSTYNLLAGGISIILMATFYLFMDVLNYQKYGFYFKVIGLNSITIYLGWRFIDFGYTSKALLNPVAGYLGDWSEVLIHTGSIVLVWFVLYFLYRNRIFLKV